MFPLNMCPFNVEGGADLCKLFMSNPLLYGYMDNVHGRGHNGGIHKSIY